jgi:hemolysin III
MRNCPANSVRDITIRPYGPTEELLHSVLHVLGAFASLVGIYFLVTAGAASGDSWRAGGGAAFGVTAFLLFAASACYHGSRDARIKNTFQKLDHSAIYLLIAGTYTAFTLSVMRDAWGWSLFAVVWAMAVFGIASEFKTRTRKPVKSAVLYLGMGWLSVVSVKQLVAGLTAWQMEWLIAGGLAYTAGVPFYVWKSRAYTHVVWHIFVLLGVACHFVAVFSVMHKLSISH